MSNGRRDRRWWARPLWCRWDYPGQSVQADGSTGGGGLLRLHVVPKLDDGLRGTGCSHPAFGVSFSSS
jgi:hypothetical protein